MQASFARFLKIVGIGDSTTAGAPGFRSPIEAPPEGQGNEQSQYAYWMMRRHPDWDVLNRGVNGERSDQILARFARDVVSERPRFAVVLAGVNDIYQGFPADFTERGLAEMYNMALKASITPVVCSVLPYNTMGAREAQTMKGLNGWIVATSEKLSIPLSDTNKAVSDPEDPDRLASSSDGLHPDVDGYRKMAVAISKVLEDRLGPEAPKPSID